MKIYSADFVLLTDLLPHLQESWFQESVLDKIFSYGTNNRTLVSPERILSLLETLEKDILTNGGISEELLSEVTGKIKSLCKNAESLETPVYIDIEN